MNDLIIGVHIAEGNAAQAVARIVAAERAGVQCVWMTSTPVSPYPLGVFAAAAGRTERVLFGSSIIPAFPRHPLVLVQDAVVVDSLAPGRLRLGVGPSHKPIVEGTYGIPFERPLEYMREYLTILKAALQDGNVDFEGRRLRARAKPAAPVPVMVMASALRKNAFRLCGELADGAISWVCPLPYLRDVAVPALREGASKAARPLPPLIAHVPVAVSQDAGAVRRAAQKRLGIYPRLPYYSRMFQDAGFPEAKDGVLSDRMIDALVVHGGPDRVKEMLRGLPSFGAAELLATPLTPDEDGGAWDMTVRTLGELAAE